MPSPPLHCGRIGCELVSWILYSMCHEFVCNFGSKFFVTISWYPWYLTCCNAATNLGKWSFAVSGCGAREGTGREGKWCSLWRGCSCDGCKNQFIYDTGITPNKKSWAATSPFFNQNSLRYIYLCAKTSFQRNTAWFSVLFWKVTFPAHWFNIQDSITLAYYIESVDTEQQDTMKCTRKYL